MNRQQYQVSVDEAVGLQVLHPLADVQAHTEQGALAEGSSPLPQVVHQAALLHELRDDVDGLLPAADAIQLHQLGVGKIPADSAAE